MAAESEDKPIISLGFGLSEPREDDGPSESEIAAAEGMIDAFTKRDAKLLARMLRESRRKD